MASLSNVSYVTEITEINNYYDGVFLNVEKAFIKFHMIGFFSNLKNVFQPCVCRLNLIFKPDISENGRSNTYEIEDGCSK